MYKIQECVDENTWLDRYSSNDYNYVCELCRAYSEKYKYSRFRVIEVYIYV